ncbi:hypothetical protein RCL1_007107 [Eukaryota sp. TZLM3-RCL]
MNTPLLTQVEDLLSSLNSRVSSLESLASECDSPVTRASKLHQLSSSTFSYDSFGSSSLGLETPTFSSPELSPSPSLDEARTPQLRDPESPFLSPLKSPVSPLPPPSVLSPPLRTVSLADLADIELPLPKLSFKSSLAEAVLTPVIKETQSLKREEEEDKEKTVRAARKRVTGLKSSNQTLNQSKVVDRSKGSSSTQKRSISPYTRVQSIPTPRKSRSKDQSSTHKLSDFALLAIENDGFSDASDSNIFSKISSFLTSTSDPSIRFAFPSLYNSVVNVLRKGGNRFDRKPWELAPDEWETLQALLISFS